MLHVVSPTSLPGNKILQLLEYKIIILLSFLFTPKQGSVISFYYSSNIGSSSDIIFLLPRCVCVVLYLNLHTILSGGIRSMCMGVCCSRETTHNLQQHPQQN